MEYPDGSITAIRHVARKMAAIKGRLVWLGDNITTEM